MESDDVQTGTHLYRDLFGPGSNKEQRYIKDHERLVEIINALRIAHRGIKVVLVQGSYDIFHIGHGRYLEIAKSYGDILIVGVDSDKKIRDRKGKNRPFIPELERVEILMHTRHVDLVTLKSPKEEKWNLIKLIQPDTLIASERTDYTEDDVEKLQAGFCKKVIVIPAQAETSTSAHLRNFQMQILAGITPFAELLHTESARMIDHIKKIQDVQK